MSTDSSSPPAASAARGPRPANAPDEGLARDLAVLRGEARPDATGRPRRRRRWPWIVGLLAFLGVGWIVWGRLTAPPEVDLVTVAWRDVGSPPVLLSASGYLEAHRQITLSSKAQGKIVEMSVAENQQVVVGDLVARLESDEARANLSLARAEFADATRELRRLERLQQRGAASQAELDRTRTQRDVAAARRDLAQVAYDNRTIVAPIDGTVIRKIRDVGEFLTIGVTAEGDPGTAVVTLADLSSLEVSLEVGETEIRKVALGGVALVTPEAMPRRRYLADVVEIAAMADRQKGVVPVTVRIREPERELLPEMSAKVSFLEAEPSAPIEVRRAVPISSVVERGGRRVVFSVEDGRVTAATVTGRETEDGFFVIDEGPEEGTPLVEAPPPSLGDGDPVALPAS
ncbi:MAG: efflux RND transporter periplasmic adaptor subunit [Myxococcota bacterium]